MRVCFLLPELRPSGGLSVALGHASRLATSDFTVDVAVPLASAAAAEAPYRLLDTAAARRESYDVAIGTWWETVPDLLEIEASARVLFVQSAEERFYRPSEPLERLGAALALAAPVHFFAVARWLEALLAELRPDAAIWHVPNGIDKSLFSPRPRERDAGPLRILIEGQHSLWFKGVDDALEAVARMREPREVTLVSLDPAGAEVPDGVRLVGGLDPSAMRDEYAAHDVLLKLSRVESVGLPVVEACHMGLPCVVTPFTGHAEVIRHGESGLVVGYDDPDGVASALDHLARDRAALDSLSAGAIAAMEGWPSSDAASESLATALREIPEAPPPLPGPAAFHRWRVAAEVERVSLGERGVREQDLEGSVRWLEDALATTRTETETLIEERDAWLRRREAQVADLESQLRAIRESRTYRAARRAQEAVDRFRR